MGNGFRSKEMQEIILSVPMGLAKLIDILLDNRDFVRNEVLLLLIQLTKSNANIQNIIAYERGFDQLFQVIRNEGYSDGGIVVDDSLQLMLNLLKRNISNQTVFREGKLLSHTCRFVLNILCLFDYVKKKKLFLEIFVDSFFMGCII